ncbi:MAG TPA: tRNA preQ1(34) S-adenosylmethionine ribosyltransferase-isomerase QueA [Cyanobacteria bacterium UBA9971]|nr:tRNA preQ1(34) S-adenosylmethionine ribosyltransferase-isomerase QueA [Cyanobacteria bacterium UBA9971]
MLSSEFDYNLPEELIAQFPCEKRDGSSLMVLDKQTKAVSHKKFFDIVDFIDENDVLVLNNTRVIPARLFGKKSTGARIEIFLLSHCEQGTHQPLINEWIAFPTSLRSSGQALQAPRNDKIWEVLIKPSKRVKSGTIIEFTEELKAKILERLPNDKWLVEFIYEGVFNEILEKVGNIPLPPYIERKLSDETIKKLDFERYQTVYAQNPGSVAAPTAGLHFTEEILDKLKQKGVEVCYVTLNVGLGTFRPVKAENILDHQMDREFYEIPEITAEIINKAKLQGKNIVAVGTTTVRTLESAFEANNKISATSAWSQMFIYPGYKFSVIDKLITNFHLPKSTLLMLVSALAGKDFVFEAYREAIEKKYRFYSYGDCMLIK